MLDKPPADDVANRGASQASNEQLAEWDQSVVWHAFTQMQEYESLIMESAEGCVFRDINGREYIDGVSNLWCNVHGHRHPKLDAAIREQLAKVAHVTSLGLSNPATIKLAKRLAELAPDGLEHVFFSDSGATSVEVAVKMAFQYWQQCENPRPKKIRYISYGQAYHGDTIGMVSVGGMPRFHEVYSPLLFQPLRLPSPQTYRLPEGVGAEAACDHYADQLEAMLAEHHEELAALVIEPLVQGAAGIVTMPEGYLARVRELTRKYDVLMIADEVAVGMGRTGKMFACEHEDVQPDLLCVAKGLTGGYLPVAATLATSEIYNAFLGAHAESKTFYHGHTYGGNPLGCAVGLATLDVFEEEETLKNLQPKIERLAEHFERIRELDHVGDIRQRGMMCGIELVADKATKTAYTWEENRGRTVCEVAIENGVWLRPLGNVVVVMPPLAVSLEQIDKICEVVEMGIRQVTEA
ncbi:MAG: adenosylmethionine--8-amino-7-oxononanoate transaminase [Planctomycetota bacterium]